MSLPPATHRGWLFDELRKNLLNIGYVIAEAPAHDLTAYRDGGSGWSVVQVICHLRDFEEIFLHRAHITIEQTFPDLPFPDPDQLAAERDYQAQDVHAAYAQWQKTRADYIAYQEALTEEQWARPAKHPRRGRMTLQDQLTVTAWHDVNHLEQILRILHEKKA